MVLSRLFRKPLQPSVPAGVRVYAVGDIHGRLDLLNLILELLVEDLERRPVERPPVIVFLGDYIDRGPESRGVIDRLLALQVDPRFEVVTLRGNHEQFLLDFLDDRATSGGAWMSYGGLSTLDSYGIAPPALRTDAEAWTSTAEALRQAVPAAHLAFLEATTFTYLCGDYLFVHAGVRPGQPLDRQTPADLTQIRQPFLGAREPLRGKVVVYGHTVVEAPLIERWKIGLDTGAFATGRLTVMRFEGSRKDHLTT